MTSASEKSESILTPTRNYTGEDEKISWQYLKHKHSFWKWNCSSYNPRFYGDKQLFRTRRSYWWGFKEAQAKKAFRIRIGNSDEIGAFVRLTNNYFLIGGDEEFESFIRTIKGDLHDIPVINTSIAGCRVIGRLCVGNKHGLIVPDGIYDTELRNIEQKLPDSVKVRKAEEKLSALGNVITCNDNVALIHPDLDKETEEIIADTLQVEVFRHALGSSPLVGSYCVLNSVGGLVGMEVSEDFLQDLSSLLQLQLLAGTVNNGSKVIASGLIVSDSVGYAGMKTTSNEFKTVETVFQFDPGAVMHR